jgi:hypothetical protein
MHPAALLAHNPTICLLPGLFSACQDNFINLWKIKTSV